MSEHDLYNFIIEKDKQEVKWCLDCNNGSCFWYGGKCIDNECNFKRNVR